MKLGTGFDALWVVLAVIFAVMIFSLAYILLDNNIIFVVIGAVIGLVYIIYKNIKRKY